MDAETLHAIAGPAGLLGLIGLAGLAGIRNPCDKDRAGAMIRHLGILGLGGLAGFWIDGAGAMGAAGALGGVALRCVTLLDCWPIDLPPPMRLASTSGVITIRRATNKAGKSFFMSVISAKFST